MVDVIEKESKIIINHQPLAIDHCFL